MRWRSMASVNVKGLDELQKLLDALPAKIEGNVVRGGLRAAAKVVLDEAKSLCPVAKGNLPKGHEPGELKESVRISMRFRKGRVTASIKAGNEKAFYAHMVEFGTAQHLIKPRNSKKLFLNGIFSKGINHPGAQKKPFMRPAIDNKAEAAVEAMAEYLRDRIPKEVEKLK